MSDAASRLVHAYADAVCHVDAEAWAETWAPDGLWEMGALQVEGRDAILATWTAAMTTYDQVVQVVYNGVGDLDESSGQGEGRWYVGEFLKPREKDPQILLAHYDDAYVRLGGTWYFAERRLTRLYSGPPDLSGGFEGPPSQRASS